MPHRAKGRPLVALLKGMSLGYRGQKSHREHDDIFLAIGESILRTAQCAFEQADVAEKMPFPGFLHLKPVFLDYRVDRKPTRLIWQGRLVVLGTAL
jgi:hypothetical protein